VEYRMSQLEEGSSKLANIGETSETLKKLKRRSRFTLFIAWIALFLTMIGIAAGYKNWMKINDRAKEATRGVASLKERSTKFADKSTILALNETLLSELKQRETALTRSADNLENVKKISQHALQVIEKQARLLTVAQEKSQTSPQAPSRKWRIAELKFLLQVANQRLQLSKDKSAALKLLRAAEDTLIKIGSSKYLPVRKKLTEEIVALEGFLMPNVAAISQRIGDLMEVVDAIPVTTEIKNSETIPLLPEKLSNHDGFLSSIVSKINSSVVIHKFDKSVQNTLGVDEKEKLQNLLHLRLETLRLMVLQDLDRGYHKQLTLIKQTLEKYYPEMINDALQQHFQALEKVQLSVEPPDISVSLKLLEQIEK